MFATVDCKRIGGDGTYVRACVRACAGRDGSSSSHTCSRMLRAGWRSQLSLLLLCARGAEAERRSGSAGMRSSSADECASDRRAAERLLSLRVLTD